MKIKTFEKICFISLFLCVILSTADFNEECDHIRDSVLRLHVIANSDSERDQQLKYTVRDELLESGSFAVSLSENKEQAILFIEDNLEFLQQKAQQTVYKKGFGYDVTVEIAKSYFPTRQYEDITLPAGYYDAVKVIIGEGKGKNWWCVMFPGLCIPAASKDTTSLVDVLSDDQMKIVKTDAEYEIRFWLVEKYYELFGSDEK